MRPLAQHIKGILRLASTAFVLGTAASLSAGHDHKESPLAEAMEAIEDAYKPLSRDLKTPDEAKVPEYLALLQTIEEKVVYAKAQVPEKAKNLPEAERAEFLKKYRKDMTIFLDAALKLERALLDGNLSEAATLAQSMKGMRKEGHEKYTDEEEEEKH